MNTLFIDFEYQPEDSTDPQSGEDLGILGVRLDGKPIKITLHERMSLEDWIWKLRHRLVTQGAINDL